MTLPDSVSYYQQEALWSEQIGASASDVRDTVLAMIPQGARSILDVGCGNGAITNHLPTDRHIEACDISEAALAHVRCDTKVADLTALPFEDGQFDLVLTTDVLEHIPEESYHKALNELYRVSARWLLVAVPYNELLEAATVNCGSCGTSFHVHWHQRFYSAEKLAGLWQGRAGAIAHAFGGARWRWSSPLVIQLLHLIKGRQYAFEHAKCPHCGAAYHPEQSEVAASIEGRLESLHYALALAGRIDWPQRSEIVMLFDKSIAASEHYVPAEDDRAPPEALPPLIARDSLTVLPDPDNYARRAYLVSEPGGMTELFLPRLPAFIRMTPNVPVAVYDPLVQRDAPLKPATDGWQTVPPVAALRFGYLFRIPEATEPWVSIEFKGDLDPWLAQSLIGPREVLEFYTEGSRARIEALLSLTEELERKRAAGEERVEALLRSCAEVEAKRADVEAKCADVEAKRGQGLAGRASRLLKNLWRERR